MVSSIGLAIVLSACLSVCRPTPTGPADPPVSYIHRELVFTGQVDKHIRHVRMFIPLLKGEHAKVSSLQAELVNRTRVVSNSANAFALLTRAVRVWLVTSNTLLALPGNFNPSRRGVARTSSESIDYFNSVLHNMTNLTTTYRAISRIQNVYHIPADTLANAKLEGALPHAVISAQDCYGIVQYQIGISRYGEAAQWLLEMSNRKEAGEKIPISETELLELRYVSMCFSGDVAGAQGMYRRLTARTGHLRPSPWLAAQHGALARYGCDRVASSAIEETKEEKEKRLLGVCGQHQPQHASKLRCRLVHYNKHGLMFMPTKIEEMNLSPPVLRFHEVLTDKQIQDFISWGAPQMYVATLYTVDRTARVTDPVLRTSSQMFMNDRTSALSAKLSRKIALMTNLNIEFAEYSKLFSYGLGGEFRPHVDARNQRRHEKYCDYANFVIYLNDEEWGGHTVFPLLNVSVAPIKGTAALWFNRHPSGAVNRRTLHASCPVVQGSKWVISKRLHIKQQSFPDCGMKRKRSYKYYYL